MSHFYDVAYLSPHPDDVVLSCGGHVAQEVSAGKKALIVTIATADPNRPLSSLARRLHRRSGLPVDSIAERRREDQAAADILGAELLQLGLEDAIYRRDERSGRSLYPRLRSLFAPPSSSDTSHPKALAASLGELPHCRRLVVPLAVGRHVDHVLVRAAAEGLGARSLLFYEDFPYALRSRALDVALRPRSTWIARQVALSPAHMEAKIEAALAYTSQIKVLFGSREKLRRQILSYASMRNGERLWLRA